MTKRNNPLFMVLPLLIFAGVAVFLICRNLFWNRQLRSFFWGRMGIGWTFAVLTAAQLALAMMNDILSKKIDALEPVSEERK